MARWQAAGLHHGRVKFRRLELNQHPPVFSGMLDLRAAPEKDRARALLRVAANQEPAVGLEPTRAALRERCSAGRAALA